MANKTTKDLITAGSGASAANNAKTITSASSTSAKVTNSTDTQDSSSIYDSYSDLSSNVSTPTTNVASNDTSSDTDNLSTYDKLLNIANGTSVYDDLSSKGNSNAYANYKNDESNYNSLYDYYMNNRDNMTTNERSSALSMLGTAQDIANASKSYYDQYVANEDSRVNAKASQYAASQNALKYIQNSMASQGLGTQGVSESTRAGVLNNYANNVASIDNSVNSDNNSIFDSYATATQNKALNNANIVDTAQQTDQSEAYSQASTLLSDAVSNLDYAKMQEIYNKYYDQLSNYDKELFEADYNNSMTAYYTSLTDNLVQKKLGSYTKSALVSALSSGQIEDGTYLFLSNKNNNKKGNYYYYSNGTITKVSKQDATNAINSSEDTTLTRIDKEGNIKTIQ